MTYLKCCRICLLLAIGIVLGASLQAFDTSIVSPYSIYGAMGLTLAALISLVLSLP